MYTSLFYNVVGVFLMLINSLLSERQSRDDLSVALARIRLYALQIENKAALQEQFYFQNIQTTYIPSYR